MTAEENVRAFYMLNAIKIETNSEYSDSQDCQSLQTYQSQPGKDQTLTVGVQL